MSEVVGAAPEAPAAAPAAPSAPAVAPAVPAVGGVDAAQKPAGEAPAGEPEAPKPDTGNDPEKKRGQRSFDRKIDRLHRRAAEAEARATLYERQLAEARQQQAPATDPNAPRIENFDDIEKYASARAKYESEKALKDHSAKQHAETQKQYAARIAGEWEERVERAVEKYDDFAEVVGEIKPTNPLSVAIMRAPNGEDLAYHLGKNPKEAQRIVGLDPVSQIFELGQLSAKLAAEPKKPPQPSKAPAPINPLSGGANQPSNEPDPSDVGNWVKWRQRQVHGARR